MKTKRGPAPFPLGSRKKDGNYWVVKTANGWEWEHRVLMEKKLGRPLRKGEQVHHLDGNGHNNAESNLVVILHADHVRLHKPVQYRKHVRNQYSR